MALLGKRGIFFLAIGLALAVYLSYPAPEPSKRLQQWLSTGKYISFRGYHVFYKDERGKNQNGPVLVCLHGFPTFSYDWLKVWPLLLEDFSRVIAPDFIGFGHSEKPYDHNYTIMEQADITEHLLHQLEVPRVHILAHDYGDTVAQELIARHDERILRKDGNTHLKILSACLLNGGLFPETHHPRLIQKILMIPYLGSVGARLTNFYLFKRSFGEVFGPETQPSSEEFIDFWASLRVRNGYTINHKIIDYIPQRFANRDRWVGALQKASMPLHVIYGPADPVNPPAFAERFRSLVGPGITVLPDLIGHYPQWEEPDGTMAAYREFLNTVNQKKDREV